MACTATAQNPAFLLQQPTLPAWGGMGTTDASTKLFFGRIRSCFSFIYTAGLMLLSL